MDSALFFQHLANGIALGSLYALIAIGYTMVYGILRLINFAHGDLLMMSAYLVYYGMLIFSLPWWLSVVLAVILTAVLGMGIERAAYRPLRDSPRISVLISAIGVSFLIQNLGTVVFGGRAKPVHVPQWVAKTLSIGSVTITTLNLLIPGVTAVLLLALSHLVYRTKTGTAMRAVARDYDTARLMGIDVDRTISLTFVTGSTLAAVGGIMWALRYPQIHPMIGVMPGLKCFIAAVFGGIGNIPGAVLGGFLLGIGEIMLVALIPHLAGYRDAFAFVILILTLLFRPTGLLGEKVAEKV